MSYEEWLRKNGIDPELPREMSLSDALLYDQSPLVSYAKRQGLGSGGEYFPTFFRDCDCTCELVEDIDKYYSGIVISEL